VSGPYKIIVIVYIGFLLSVIASNVLALITLKLLRPHKLPPKVAKVTEKSLS
jgi:hypothetical protein